MSNTELTDKCEKESHREAMDFESVQMLKKRGLDIEQYFWCNHPRRTECRYYDSQLGLMSTGLCTKR